MQTLRDVSDRGLEESRYLLQEWLCSFLTHYLLCVKKCFPFSCLTCRHKAITDTTFRTVPKLRIIAKYIYGCLNNALLDLAKARSFAALLENISTVSWVWRRSVMVRRLPPQLLSRYLYPQLSTYSDSNTLHIPRLNLSMRSLLAV